MGEGEKGNPGDPDMGNRDGVESAPGKPDTTIPDRKRKGNADDGEKEKPAKE